MSAPPTVRYAAKIVIDSSNNVIHYTDSVGSSDATITPGNYYFTGDINPASDLMNAIETALDADSSDDWSVRYNSDNTVGITNEDSAWAIDWDHANTTFDPDIIGIEDASAAFNAAAGVYADTDNHIQYTWTSSQAVAGDSGVGEFGTISSPITQSRARSGAVYTVKTGSTTFERIISHAFETEAKTWPAATPDGSSFYEFLYSYAGAGTTVRYYPDSTDGDGEFQGIFDQATLEAFTPQRLQPGVNLYSWTVRMLWSLT